MSETIREFVVSLGFANDEASKKRFEESLESATKKAFEFGTALEGIALVAATALSTTAQKFSDLKIQSEVLGTSVANIKALQGAFKELGGSAEQANSLLSQIRESVTKNPGNVENLKKAGLEVDKVTGSLIGYSAALEKANLGKYDSEPQIQRQAHLRQEFDIMGITDLATQKFLTDHTDELQEIFNRLKQDSSSQGIDFGKMSEDGRKFERVVSDIFIHLENTADKWSSKIEAELVGPLQKVDDFIHAHPDLSALLGLGGGAVAYKGGKALLQNILGTAGLEGSATALTGSAAELTEAAVKLQAAALTRGPGGVPGGPVGTAAPAVAPAASGGLLALLAKAPNVLLAGLAAFGAYEIETDPEVAKRAGEQFKRARQDGDKKSWAEIFSQLWRAPDQRPPVETPHARPPVAAPSSVSDADRHAAYRSLQDAGYNTSFLGIGGTSYIDAEVGTEEDREARRGRALGGLQEPQGQPRATEPPNTQEQPHRVATATPKRPDDDLRDQRFEALRAMLDIGTSDSARAVTVNGAPVSEGNPLPVTFGQKDQLALEGTEAFGGAGGTTGPVPDTRTFWEKHAPAWAGGKPDPNEGYSGGINVPADRRGKTGSAGFGLYATDVGLAANKSLPPEARAFLDTIGTGETPSGSYSNVDNDPGGLGGRYQFLRSTWVKWAREIGVDPKDFTPENQDKAAFAYASALVKERTGKQLTELLKGGAEGVREAIAAVSPGAWNGIGNVDPDKAGHSGAVRLFLKKLQDEQNAPKDISPVTPPAVNAPVASAIPPSNIHIPNAYAGGESSEYPAKTEHSYWQPPAHPEEHSSQVSANPYTPSWMPHIDADWIHDTFAMPHAEAATLPQANHTFTQSNTYNVEGNEPSIMAHQIASRVQRSATDLTAQFRGALQ